ncbi:FliM/FliN family flagellar motor switch protein [Spongiibacter nanhainus]|uniref:Flagellar motor switch protein FliM n=1 Tax=Spongiibacter nanhainus TaxID=2794344 RepID=A0A7T4QXV2_9GAMM|nr:FliM/FliN family flagellar motor switch protein [Spongiibacter nanhainus]QQD16795.1 FliM/FliN family flagellar motor switch protein [Spongiibacter nanhainus]
MTESLLSQNEIDALLQQLKSPAGASSLSAQQTVAAPQRYDLSRRRRPSRQGLPGLAHICRRFAEGFTEQLHNLVGPHVEVSLLEIQTLPFGEYLHSLYVPTSLNVMDLSPLPGSAIVAMDARMVFRLLERFFGGGGRYDSQPGRRFSRAEERLVAQLLPRLNESLNAAWRPVMQSHFHFVDQHTNPAMVRVADRGETAVVCRFLCSDVVSGDSECHLVIPEASLQPVRERLARRGAAQQRHADPVWTETLRRGVLDSAVPTRCTVAERQTTLRAVTELAVGDVISLGSRDRSLLTAAGIPVARGQLGVKDGQLALEVHSLIELGEGQNSTGGQHYAG